MLTVKIYAFIQDIKVSELDITVTPASSPVALVSLSWVPMKMYVKSGEPVEISSTYPVYASFDGGYVEQWLEDCIMVPPFNPENIVPVAESPFTITISKPDGTPGTALPKYVTYMKVGQKYYFLFNRQYAPLGYAIYPSVRFTIRSKEFPNIYCSWDVTVQDEWDENCPSDIVNTLINQMINQNN